MAESERYLPSLIDRLESELDSAGLADEAITIRMTGCPNGCARPYLAEIGLVGKAPGRYNLYLGGAFNGDRLNSPHLDNADEATIVSELASLFRRFAADRHESEHFGEFLLRAGIAREAREGRHFQRELDDA